MSNNNLIEVKQLSRHYGNLTAVDQITFELKRGEVLGFLGPNGAGKSTTMQIITGNLSPTSGQISICGFDLLDKAKQAKANIGYLPEQPPLYRDFTVDEYLHFSACINRITKPQRAPAIVRSKKRCGLQQVGRRLIGNLSKGYQQRVGIAQAIIHLPDIIVLDEPTVGLDPIQIREIRELIQELGQQHGVILSTHILPEVQMTCDRVQIINHGKLVFSDNIASLNQQMQATTSLILRCKNPPKLADLLSFTGVEKCSQIDTHSFKIEHCNGDDLAEAIIERAVKQAWRLYEIKLEQKTLEQVFIDITAGDSADENNMEPNR